MHLGTFSVNFDISSIIFTDICELENLRYHVTPSYLEIWTLQLLCKIGAFNFWKRRWCHAMLKKVFDAFVVSGVSALHSRKSYRSLRCERLMLIAVIFKDAFVSVMIFWEWYQCWIEKLLCRLQMFQNITVYWFTTINSLVKPFRSNIPQHLWNKKFPGNLRQHRFFKKWYVHFLCEKWGDYFSKWHDVVWQ